jgi:hypothetical protein
MKDDSQLVSVAEAARLVGRDRRTLYRDYLATGKLSSIQDDATKRKLVYVSELIRVFGSISKREETSETVIKSVSTSQLETHIATTETVENLLSKIAILESENAGLRDRVSDKDKHIDDLRATVRLLEFKSSDSSKSHWWWPFGKK